MMKTPDTKTSEPTLFDQANREWDAGKAKQAFKLFLLAAKQGETNALNSIGYFFDKGIGVPKNTNKALVWYKKAARAGDTLAYANIGIVYRNRRNLERARFWFLKAIKSGDGEAALELAKVYLKRQSPSDFVRAKQYLHMALNSQSICESAIDEAKALLKNIND